MCFSAQRKGYPYPKSRVYLSLVIALLSLSLALMLLLIEPTSILLYALLTIIITVATFLLKKRLYPLIMEEQPDQTATDHAGWKMLLLAFLMLIGFVLVPLLLAGFLSAQMWFILMVSFITGVSISEIILYLHP